MSQALDDLQIGFEARLELYGETFTVMSGAATGKAFPAILMPFAALDPRMELGRDPREYASLQCLRDDYPDGIESQDSIKSGGSDPSDPALYSWRVVDRDDNPGDFAVKLFLVKIVEGKDLSS